MSVKSKLNQEASQAAAKLLTAVNELLAANGDGELPIDDDTLRQLCSRIESARTGYPLVMKERGPWAIDRLGGVLLGPIFTSQAHPWPVDDVGKPMAPLCQLNSSQFPEVVDGIDGLVQVWMRPADNGVGGVLMRMIPAAEADAALMTPVIASGEYIKVLLPDAMEWLRDFHSEPRPSKSEYITAAARKLGHANDSALADADWDEWSRIDEEYTEKHGCDYEPCFQVTGFGKARVYCDITVDQTREVARLDKLIKKLKKNGANGRDGLIHLVEVVGESFKVWTGMLGKQTYPCMLGTFESIQYCAADRDVPLVCFEAIGQREWGDGGNAQVFYSKENGFSFDWSCS